LNRLGKFKPFNGVVDEVVKNLDIYKKWYDSQSPAEFDLGERWSHLDKF
jgi:hypothetical protein